MSNPALRSCLAVNLIKTILITSTRAKLKSVLTIKVHTNRLHSRESLLNKGGRLGTTVVAGITHLQASEIKHLDVLADPLSNVLVSVVAIDVVVASSKLSSVRTVVIPPVYTRDLGSKRDLPATKDLLGDGEDIITVLKKTVLVPGKEEPTVVRGIVIEATRGEETSVRWVRVPAAGVVGFSIAPLRVASLFGSLLEIGKKVLVVDLEFTYTTVGPALVLLVARVTELRSRTKTDADAIDGFTDLVAESRREGSHEVLVHVEGSATVKERLVVSTKVDVLLIGLAIVVLVEDVVVVGTNRGDERRQRDVALITNIATTLVEAHDDLELKANALAHVSDGLVSSEVIRLGAGLRETPPDIDHNTLDSHVLESDEILLKLSRVVHAVRSNSIQRKHDIHRNSGTECGKNQNRTTNNRNTTHV